MRVTVDPRHEWKELYVDAWRRYRDWFYDPHMHASTWPGMRDRYSHMLDDCASRNDVGYVVRELISELNVGHAYYNPPRSRATVNPAVPVGLLAATSRSSRAPTRSAHLGGRHLGRRRARAAEPAVRGREGRRLPARVDGVPMDTAVDPWAPFVGKAGRDGDAHALRQATLDDSARKVLVTPTGSEGELRYRAWVEGNRKHAERPAAGASATSTCPTPA
jgi:tricorn protease